MANYYFTFGCGIDDPHRNCYTVIQAESYNEARDIMFDRFGSKWAFQYEEKDWFIDPKDSEDFKFKAMMHGIDLNRTEPISQAELYGLTQIK